MQLKNLFADEDAVSPVIGVILMVAITVILAAVIGAFVLGIGGSQEKTPQASFEIAINSDDDVIVTHQGGDEIDTDTISFNVGGSSVAWSSGTWSGGSEWTAGETFDTDTGAAGDEVQVIWSSPNSDSTNIIGEGTA